MGGVKAKKISYLFLEDEAVLVHDLLAQDHGKKLVVGHVLDQRHDDMPCFLCAKQRCKTYHKTGQRNWEVSWSRILDC